MIRPPKCVQKKNNQIPEFHHYELCLQWKNVNSEMCKLKQLQTF